MEYEESKLFRYKLNRGKVMANEVFNEIGLDATKQVFASILEIVKAGELIFEDGKVNFADVGAVMPLVLGGTLQKLVENLPQSLKELDDLNAQEVGQVASWVWQTKDIIRNIIKQATAGAK